MEFNDRSLVLRLGPFREADLWLRLLSPTRGVFSAFAFGGRRSRRRFGGCLDIFNEALFHVKSQAQGRYWSLQEALLLKGPERLRRDWRRLGMAVNCARFLEAFRLTPDGAATAHSLFAELLNSLEGQTAPSPFLPVFFRARLTISQGYALSPRHCSACGQPWGNDDHAVFYTAASGMLCPACAAGAKREGFFRFQPDELGVLRQVLELPLAHWALDAYPERAQKNCAGALDGFLRYHLGLGWEGNRFMSL